MVNYRFTFSYDGTRYHGWESKTNADTVEGRIEAVLTRMVDAKVDIHGAGRTDAGVHARAMVANGRVETDKTPEEIKDYLNRYLPRDIAVLKVEAVDERFHSQLLAKETTYLYRIDTKSIASVFERKYSYHTFHPLDYEAMNKAAAYFLGKHDFKAFTTARKSKSTEREIKNITISCDESGIAQLRITANDFLHNMARLMIGILLDVGTGLKKPENVRDILDGKDVQMSLPAESYGLFLEEVRY